MLTRDDAGRLSVHDIQLDFLRRRCPDRAAVRDRLLAAYAHWRFGQFDERIDRVRGQVGELRAAQDRLAKQEETLSDLRARYTEVHPRIRLAEEGVASARAQVAQLARELPGTLPAETAEVRTVPEGQTDRGESVRQLATLQADEVALQTKAKTLEIQVDQLRKSLRSLSQDEAGYSSLRRAVDAQRDLLTVLSDKLVGVTIREQREAGGLPGVIDSASLPFEPTRSKTHAYALAALLLSGALAVGVAFAFEWQRQPVETESDS